MCARPLPLVCAFLRFTFIAWYILSENYIVRKYCDMIFRLYQPALDSSRFYLFSCISVIHRLFSGSDDRFFPSPCLPQGSEVWTTSKEHPGYVPVVSSTRKCQRCTSAVLVMLRCRIINLCLFYKTFLQRMFDLILICPRLLRDAIQEPVFGQRYSHVLGALLCMCGAGLRAEFDKQTRLVQLLGALAENVRQSSGSARQVRAKEHFYQTSWADKLRYGTAEHPPSYQFMCYM